MLVRLVVGLTGCDTEDGATLPSEMPAQVQLVIDPGHHYTGEEGGISGDIIEVDGCLGVEMADGAHVVISLPLGTEQIEGGARLSDETELIIGAQDVFILGTTAHTGDPLFPATVEECMGKTVVMAFASRPTSG